MELIYAALLLHKSGKKINEENIKKIVSAVGISKDDAQIKALVSALDGVDIEKTLKEAAMPVAMPAAQAPQQEKSAEKNEEKKEEKREEEEAKATAGLGALFG